MLEITPKHFFKAYPNEEPLPPAGILIYKEKTIKVRKSQKELKKGDHLVSLSCQLFWLLNHLKKSENPTNQTNLKFIANHFISNCIKKQSIVQRIISALSNFFHGYGLQSDIAMWQKIQTITPSQPVSELKIDENQVIQPMDSFSTNSKASLASKDNLKPMEQELAIDPLNTSQKQVLPAKKDQSAPSAAKSKSNQKDDPKAVEEWDASHFFTVNKQEALTVFELYKETAGKDLFHPFSFFGQVDNSAASQKFRENFRYIMASASEKDIQCLEQTDAFYLEDESLCSQPKLDLIFNALTKEQLVALIKSCFTRTYRPRTCLFLNLLRGICLINQKENQALLFSTLINVTSTNNLLQEYLSDLGNYDISLKENLILFFNCFIRHLLSQPQSDNDQWLLILAIFNLVGFEGVAFKNSISQLTVEEKKDLLAKLKILENKIKPDEKENHLIFLIDFDKHLNYLNYLKKTSPYQDWPKNPNANDLMSWKEKHLEHLDDLIENLYPDLITSHHEFTKLLD